MTEPAKSPWDDGTWQQRAWAAPYGTDHQRAWDECPYGDWLLAIASHHGVPRQRLVLAACACARLVLAHVPPWEDGRPRVITVIETVERWTRGAATVEEVTQAKGDISGLSSAYTASTAASCAAHAVTHTDYAHSARYAYAAALRAAEAAAESAASAHPCAEVAATAARRARDATRRACADIVRQHIPFGALTAE